MLDNKCNSCGNNLYFDVAKGQVICAKCGNGTTFEKSRNYSRHHIDLNAQIIEQKVTKAVTKHCESCGAVFTGEKNLMAKVCGYCGAPLVLDYENHGEVSPDACLPFVLTPENARQSFYQVIKKKKFVPSEYKNGNIPDLKIQSMYIPAYSFNASTINDYDVTLERSFKDREGYTRTVTRTVHNVLDINVNNMMLECSSFITQGEFNDIKPFDMTAIYKYDDYYVLGYSVENPNRTLNDIRQASKELIDKDIQRKIRDCYQTENVRDLNIRTTYTSVDYSYFILPTYQITYTYKGKEYRNTMNGQTGKVGGKFPKSMLKILIYVLMIMGISIAVILLILEIFKGIF